MPTLAGLNSLTVDSPSESSEYVPSYDEAAQQEYNLRNSQFSSLNVDPDLVARGWEEPLDFEGTYDGNAPVRFTDEPVGRE